MDILKVVIGILSATGLWKFVELLLNFRVQNRLKNAEIRNLNIQANSLVIENYKMWSEKMEKRIEELEDKNAENTKVIKELENKNAENTKIITEQRIKIDELQGYVDQLEEEIKSYRKK